MLSSPLLSSPLLSFISPRNRSMDDVWNDIDSLSSPATNHYQNCYAPPLRLPPGATTNFFPPPTSPTTILSLTTSNSDHEDPSNSKRPKPNPPLCNFATPTPTPAKSPPVYTEKFQRLMKNRESAARSRARKQARADELEHEVVRLAKENAKLKRLQIEVCASSSHVPKGSRHQRNKSAPF